MMIKNIFLIILCSISITNVTYAQIQTNIYYHIDSSKSEVFDKIKTLKFDKKINKVSYGFVRYPFWLRIDLPKNDIHKPLLLEIRLADSLIVWQKDRQGNWKSTLTGDLFPFNTRPIVHYNYLFPLTLANDTTNTIYVCYRNRTQTRIKLNIWEADEFYKKDRNYQLFYGFLYGIFVLMIFYNIFIWVAVRDTAYLYYIGFAFFMLLLQSSRHNYQFVFGDMPFFNNSGTYWWVGSVNFCAAHFGRLFLDTRKYSPAVERAFWYASFYGALIALLATFLSYPAISRIVLTINPFYTLFLVLMGILIWRKGNPYAKYYVFAWLAYMGGVVVLALYNRNLIGESFIVNHALQISTITEVVMLSLAMSYKYKIINEESMVNKLKLQALAYEHRLKKEENNYLQDKIKQEQAAHEESIAFKDRELAIMAMQILEKNNFIYDIQKQLQKFNENDKDSTQHLKTLGKTLQDSINLDGDWENFSLHFEQVHPLLFKRFASTYPNLTTHDLKIIAYLRINLSTKEVARLLNIDAKSVKMIKYRLKKKLRLGEEEDLEIFIRSF